MTKLVWEQDRPLYVPDREDVMGQLDDPPELPTTWDSEEKIAEKAADALAYLAKRGAEDTAVMLGLGKTGFCQNCGAEIVVMIFRGDYWCSEDCRKALVAEYGEAIQP